MTFCGDGDSKRRGCEREERGEARECATVRERGADSHTSTHHPQKRSYFFFFENFLIAVFFDVESESVEKNGG